MSVEPGEKFYLVWTPSGPRPPQKVHELHHQAVDAAREMATRHPGTKFYVVEATDEFVSVAVQHTELDDPMPF